MSFPTTYFQLQNLNFKIKKSNKLSCQQNWSTIKDGPQLGDHVLQLVYIEYFLS